MLAAFRFVAREIPHAIQLYKGLPGIHVAARNPNEEEAAEAAGTIIAATCASLANPAGKTVEARLAE